MHPFSTGLSDVGLLGLIGLEYGHLTPKSQVHFITARASNSWQHGACEWKLVCVFVDPINNHNGVPGTSCLCFVKAGQVSSSLQCTLCPEKGAKIWKEQVKVKESVWRL